MFSIVFQRVVVVTGSVGGFLQSLARVTYLGGWTDEGAVDLGELMMLR